MLVILFSFAAIIGVFLIAVRVKASGLELSLLLLSVLAQLLLLFVGSFDDLHNPHQGGVVFAWITLIAIATFLGELFMTLERPSRWRFLQLTGVPVFTVLLIALVW